MLFCSTSSLSFAGWHRSGRHVLWSAKATRMMILPLRNTWLVPSLLFLLPKLLCQCHSCKSFWSSHLASWSWSTAETKSNRKQWWLKAKWRITDEGRERERERGAKKKILFLNVFAVAVTLCQWFSVGAIERGCGILPNLLKRHANFKWRLFRYGIDQHLNYGPDLFFFYFFDSHCYFPYYYKYWNQVAIASWSLCCQTASGTTAICYLVMTSQVYVSV